MDIQKLIGPQWNKSHPDLTARTYNCGYCGERVSSSRGYEYARPGVGHPDGFLRVCSDCGCPTFFQDDGQWPGSIGGESVQMVPEQVHNLYEEARRCISTSAFTASVLASRKLLMHIAVDQGAKPNESFKAYVDWLESNHFTPPNSKKWVDHIRPGLSQRSGEQV